MFKKVRAFSYWSILPFLAALFALGWFWYQSGKAFIRIYPFVVLLFVLYFIVLVAGKSSLNNKIGKRLLAHWDECRPDKMAEGYLKESTVPTKTVYSRVYYINLSSAYIGLGEWQTAKKYLQKLSLPPLSSPNGNTTLVAKNNLCVCHMALGEMQEAKGCIDWLLGQGKNLRAPGNASSTALLYQYKSVLIQLLYRYEMALGNDEGAESYYTKEWEIAATLAERVAVQYQLAGLYLRRGALEQARMAFEYVAQNGGTTWYAAAAQEQLQKMAS